MAPLPVLIDTDPGIDDSVALLFALLSPALAITAITTVSGNLPADICARNARTVLALSSNPAARRIPVAQGPLAPLARPYPRDPFSHGADGLGDLRLPASTLPLDARPAPDVILDAANAAWAAREGDAGDAGLTIVCLGPLTNLALALQKDPALVTKLRKVVCIAGSFGFGTAGTVRATGDNPASEWNVYVDPEAASLVFGSGLGTKIVALGLDVTTRGDIDLSAAHRAMLAQVVADGGKTKAEAEFLLGVVKFGESKGFPSYCCLIDAVAVAAVLDESIVTLEKILVAVETESKLSLGQTIVDRREHRPWLHLPAILAASDIDAGRFLDLLVNTIALSERN